LHLTSGFREVFAKQKFGWSLQGGISKSLLNEGERSERLQAVPKIQRILSIYIQENLKLVV